MEQVLALEQQELPQELLQEQELVLALALEQEQVQVQVQVLVLAQVLVQELVLAQVPVLAQGCRDLLELIFNVFRVCLLMIEIKA